METDQTEERPRRRPLRATPPTPALLPPAPALPAHPASPSTASNAPPQPRHDPVPLSHPIASISVHRPATYTPRGAPPTAFQLPLHLTSFSYSPTRKLLLNADKDAALAHYVEPVLGTDLNRGYEECTWREDKEDEGLDALLDALTSWVEGDTTGMASELLGKTSVITWRGMMTKLMLAVYEVEGASRGRAEGWEMNAMVIDGTLYLEEVKSPAKIAAKAASESFYKLQSYYGYSFEAYCTSSPYVPRHAPPTFEPPNTNVQWCSIVKTNLGGFRAILGGEVDCVVPRRDGKAPKTEDFVELKTNIFISSPREEVSFERQKLLKHYVQSFLLGVPTVIVGFRTRPGILTALQTFRTLEIPRLVRGKPHAWDPLACLASARTLLAFLHSQISDHASTRAAQETFESGEVGEWPVFRVAFEVGRAEVGVREMGREEVERDVVGGKRGERRCGMLLERWVMGVGERRKERERHAPAPSTTLPIPAPASYGGISLQR